MPAVLDVPDRRAALKERHRRSIVAAAAALIDETGGVHFSVDRLAERADVSRRTVFNHFGSLDEVVVAVCSDVLGALVERFLLRASNAPGGADRGVSPMFDEVVHALRETDLVAPMAYLTRVLGSPGDESPRRSALMLRSLSDLGDRFSTAMAARHPEADLLDIHLLCNSLMTGLMVLHGYWYHATGGVDDAGSREVWSGLLDRLVVMVRDGWASAAARGTP